MEKGRKKTFSECEVEVLISEVEARNNILFGSLSSGISTKTKKLAWEKSCQVCQRRWGGKPNCGGH